MTTQTCIEECLQEERVRNRLSLKAKGKDISEMVYFTKEISFLGEDVLGIKKHFRTVCKTTSRREFYRKQFQTFRDIL